MVPPRGTPVFARMKIVSIKIKCLKGTVPYHLRINTAVRRIIDIFIKQTVQGFADIKHRFVLMDGQGVRCNPPWHYCKNKLLFYTCIGRKRNLLVQAQFGSECHNRWFFHLPNLSVPVKKQRAVRLPFHMYPAAKQACWQFNILRDYLLMDGQIPLRGRNQNLLVRKRLAHHIHNLVRAKHALKYAKIRYRTRKITVGTKLRPANIVPAVIFLIFKGFKPFAQALVCTARCLADLAIRRLFPVNINTWSGAAPRAVLRTAHAHCHMHPLAKRVGEHGVCKKIPILKADSPEIPCQKHIWSMIILTEIKNPLPDIGALRKIHPRRHRNSCFVIHPVKDTVWQFKIGCSVLPAGKHCCPPPRDNPDMRRLPATCLRIKTVAAHIRTRIILVVKAVLRN